jgi:hypothetical protein
MKYAYIENNTIVDLVGRDPFELFLSGYASEFIQVHDDVESGYVLVDGEFVNPQNIPITKTPEQIRTEAKAKRDADVAAIVVTTSTGKQFNGDETSQTRIARAIVAMQAAKAQSITWVLATNDATDVTLAELSEALVLAGQAQAAIWVLPK